jgi:hypothetical protein
MPVQPQSPAIFCCHPDTPSGVVKGIKAFPRLGKGKVLTVTYVLNGIIDRLRVPIERSARRADGLWQHTCFEAFVAVKVSPTYYEFNFSPSGEWAAYSFRGYRDGASLENDNLDPRIALRRQANTLELNAEIRLNHLPAVPERASLRLGLSAVIEDTEGRLSYWALRHAPGKPDFHYPDTFLLNVSR